MNCQNYISDMKGQNCTMVLLWVLGELNHICTTKVSTGVRVAIADDRLNVSCNTMV
jgi:hypothetical protein